jgi:hypothetical protein
MKFYYVSMGMIGRNPNNAPGIYFGVELDTNLDGFGDFLIIAAPPYTEDWTAENVRVFSDTNRDSAGLSPLRSDAPFSGDGYDSLIFDIPGGIGDDPDLAWVRSSAGSNADIQFAFKKLLAGNTFMFGVLADAGLKDVSMMDYVDYFTESEAGSPIRSRGTYPLKSLFAVDNTCWEVVGFTKTGFEPKVCPPPIQPTREAGQPPPPPSTCDLSAEICFDIGCAGFDAATCTCNNCLY